MVTRSTIAIIGAGLAGAACARTLARAAHDVTVFDGADHPASGASGNPVGILHQLVSRDHNLASQWIEIGMATTLRWLKELQPLADASALGRLGESCGVLQMNGDCTELVCWDLAGAWIRPAQFVQACLQDAQSHGARLRMNDAVISLTDEAQLRFADGRCESFDAVVVCAGGGIGSLLPNASLMLNSIRGTVSMYSIPSHIKGLPCVICATGYATPVIDGEMVVGASFERLTQGDAGSSASAQSTLDERAIETTESDFESISNLDRLKIIAPELADRCRDVPVTERTSTRSATLDRMPHIGRVMDHRVPLAPSVSQLHQVPRHPKIWVLGGLGSRGLSSAPLGAEMIAAQMQAEPMHLSNSSQKELPLRLPDRVARAVDPVRFALRRHQRGIPC